jgi:hypothetical protein
MKIEFRCDQCDRLLRVSDFHIGKLIACPACHNSLVVPAAEFEEAVFPIEGLQSAVTSERIWDPQTASLRRILQETWALYVQNMGMLVVVTLVDLLLWLVGIVLIFIPALGTFAVLQQAVGFPISLSMLAMLLVILLGFTYLVNTMTCSQTRFFLKVARGERTSIRDAFSVGGGGKVTMLPTLFAVLTMSGLLLLVLPGVAAYLFFWPYIWVWADRQTGDRDGRAFSLAGSLSSRNVGTSLAITGIGLAMTFVGLSFFGYSLFGMLKAVAYLRMSGQEVTGLDRMRPVVDETLSDEESA